MQITKLPPGEMASEDTDCIKIDRAADGSYTLVASALLACGDADEAESVALIAGDPYDSYEAAEAAGLAWAANHCVEHVYIETSA